ncbi:hypothetical protein EMPG_10269 [Blastomyces silverae]|uniref:Uncharacterized protein n=1 Tax=Blastomyces silverae TaxID=2060906 RepID=A0A0H1B5U2_9EURO|nr:hypothetical protein EMPG_10269 [Blastomyces silverae]
MRGYMGLSPTTSTSIKSPRMVTASRLLPISTPSSGVSTHPAIGQILRNAKSAI